MPTITDHHITLAQLGTHGIDRPLLGINDAGRPLIHHRDHHPHLRISGETGQGKSVAVNTIAAHDITHRNPNSAYHLSLGISYPNQADRAFAKAHGKKPGGDIFIHGGPNEWVMRRDWTAGCIAVTDAEIEAIWDQVELGTPVLIKA